MTKEPEQTPPEPTPDRTGVPSRKMDEDDWGLGSDNPDSTKWRTDVHKSPDGNV